MVSNSRRMGSPIQWKDEELAPSEVRQRILDEHREIREHLRGIDQLARQVMSGDASRVRLARKMRELHAFLMHHLDLEDAILAPALRDTDAFGPVRAEQLVIHHHEQRGMFAAVIGLADDPDSDAQTLARTILQLAEALRADMAHEDRDLLSPELLRDDPLNVDIFTG